MGEGLTPREQVATELRRQRALKRESQKMVARAMDWSGAKLRRIEAGEVTIAVVDLRALLAYYGISDEQEAFILLELTRAARHVTLRTIFERQEARELS